MNHSPAGPARFFDRVASVSWRDLILVGAPVLVVVVLAGWVAVKAIHFAPPGTIRIVSGPDGSSYRTSPRSTRRSSSATA